MTNGYNNDELYRILETKNNKNKQTKKEEKQLKIHKRKLHNEIKNKNTIKNKKQEKTDK